MALLRKNARQWLVMMQVVECVHLVICLHYTSATQKQEGKPAAADGEGTEDAAAEYGTDNDDHDDDNDDDDDDDDVDK